MPGSPTNAPRYAASPMSIPEWPVGIWPAPRAIYEKWGAAAKVAALDRDYANLIQAAVSVANDEGPPSRRHQSESFDIAAALQASRLIASGENTDRVLTHLMQIIRIQAGAETAQLLILEGGSLRLEAECYGRERWGDVVLRRAERVRTGIVLAGDRELCNAHRAGADARRSRCGCPLCPMQLPRKPPA